MITRAHILAGLALFLAGFLAGREWRDRSADLAESRQEVKQLTGQVEAVQDARQAEQAQAGKLAEIGEKHELDRQASEGVADSVVADLRAGNYRLRHELASCETSRLSESSESASKRDAGAISREEIAAAAVRIARDADDQLRACQAVVRTYDGSSK